MQPGGWAAALRKGLNTGEVSGQNENEPIHSGSEALAQGEASSPAAALNPPLSGKAARASARQRLLAETLKSRANAVTGERHCLACGRGFLDLSRFAQHLADKHGGVNSVAAPVQAPPPDAAAFPMLAPAPRPLRLSDVAVMHQGPGDAPNAQHAPRKTGPAAAGARGAPPHRPGTAPAAFQAPEGTRARRKKRPSRLKREYMRSKAAAAVEHWLSVLSAVEEALQVAGEAHGAALNEAAAARAVLEAAPSKEEAARLFVRLQVLKAQGQGAMERLEGLSGVHHAARAHLLRAQKMLREADGGDKWVPEEAGRAQEPTTAVAAAQPPSAPQPEPEPEFESEHHAPAAVEGSALPLQAADEEAAAAEGDATPCASASGSSSDDDDASGLGGFQNVLGQWAQASGATAKPSAPKPKPEPPPPSSPAPLPQLAPHPRTGAAQQNVATEEEKSAHIVPQKVELGSPSSSSSSGDGESDNGSSFGLQWGDTLRTWAVNAGADARAALDQQRQEAAAVTAPMTEGVATASRAEASAGPSLVPLSPPEHIIQHSGSPEAPDIAEPQLLPPAVASPDAGPSVVSPPRPPAPAAPVQMPGSEVVRAWLSRKDAPPQGAFVPPPPSEAGASAASPGGLVPSAAPFVPRMDLQILGTSTHTLHSAPLSGGAVPPPGLHCPLCGVTASGPKAWMDHLNSRRHISRVRQSAEGATAAELAALPQPLPSRGAAAATPTGLPAPPRTYVGPGADVAPYVDHVITPELNAAVEALLRRLLEWQERSRRLDPVNARRKRRVVSGMREVEKAAKLGKAKLLVVAPNVGALAAGTAASAAAAAGEGDEGGRGGALTGESSVSGDFTYPVSVALEWARQKEVPVVFAMTRQRLGRLLGARKTASAFAVLEASGAEQSLRDLVTAVTAAREEQRQGEHGR